MADERRPLIVRQDTRCDQRSRKNKQWACAAILGADTLERIAFYGVTGNLVLFLNKDPFSWMSYNASNALFVFMGLSFVLCIFEGWIADAYLGRFKTIFIFFFIYLGGYILLPLLFPYPFPKKNEVEKLPQMCSMSTNMSEVMPSSIPINNWTNVITDIKMISPGDESCAPFVYLSLVLMAIGSAAFKTNIAPFGGDQVKSEGPQASRVFFNWFYWSVNIGSFIALGPIAFLQQEVSFFWGYLIPCICLFLAMIVFCAGSKFYLVKPQSGSVLTSVFNVIIEACSMKRKRNKRRKSFRTIDTAGASSEGEPQAFLDHAKSRFGGSFHDNDVEEVRTLGKTTLIFITMIPYWIGYYQMETTFLTQGLHMRLSPWHYKEEPNVTLDGVAGNSTNSSGPVRHFQIPAAVLSLFDVIFVIILIPIMDRCIYPRLDRMNKPLLLKNRIAIGMAVSVLAMVCAGVVENQRLAIFWENGTDHPNPITQVISNTTFYAADMTIAWQIPQYALIGVSEVFASIGGLELAYSLSPKSMQGLVMGLFYFMSGIGSFLGSATMYMFQNVWFFTWDQGNINCRFKCSNDLTRICGECHMDYYFFFLAGVQVFGLVLYLTVITIFGLGKDPRQRRFNPESSINQATPSASKVDVSCSDLKQEKRNGSAEKQPVKGYDMNYTA